MFHFPLLWRKWTEIWGFSFPCNKSSRELGKWKGTCVYQWRLQTPLHGWWFASKSKCTRITCWSFYRCLSNKCEQLIFHIFITPSGVELWLLKCNSNNCVSFHSIIYGMLVCVDTLLFTQISHFNYYFWFSIWHWERHSVLCTHFM